MIFLVGPLLPLSLFSKSETWELSFSFSRRINPIIDESLANGVSRKKIDIVYAALGSNKL